MRVEFRQGVPKGLTAWLRDEVGPGNITSGPREWFRVRKPQPDDEWFYERIYTLDGSYVPTITIKDKQKAVFFALKWS